ncbi:DUF2590 family protein [Pseudodesulfovibrio sediminis]|uniref:DUF2590 family protein n=1 Tax=Pseudodesulfovibrio sediminis TaxID=2810563 RepID=A0ABM7PA59_9BACT|nr:DUF2590 family protein [Pseudodesulfovibrio sediminis]BCS89962.1 hypothetical protein PSDVSF_32040 [Pseudodesulfovibrio sediminis]
MAEEKYFDLLITDDDITLDAGGIPERCSNRDSIAQDIVHMIRETGLLVELVGNRDERKKAENVVKLTMDVDNDERIVPGTCAITEPSLGVFYLQAETVEFGPIYTTVEIS